MYFQDTKFNKFAKTMITRKMHLVKELKANLLIENDVLKSKIIDFSNFTEIVCSESCEITISMIIKTKFRSQSKSVYAFQTFIISFRSKILILVYNIISFSVRDFLFKL